MKKIILLLAVIALGASACKKQGPYEKIEGTWLVASVTLLGATVEGDGSSITFNACETPPCPGSDYKKSDNTTGMITYEFLDEASILAIVDTSNLGGNNHAEWDVSAFTATRLTLSADAGIFGTVSMKLEKE